LRYSVIWPSTRAAIVTWPSSRSGRRSSALGTVRRTCNTAAREQAASRGRRNAHDRRFLGRIVAHAHRSLESNSSPIGTLTVVGPLAPGRAQATQAFGRIALASAAGLLVRSTSCATATWAAAHPEPFQQPGMLGGQIVLTVHPDITLAARHAFMCAALKTPGLQAAKTSFATMIADMARGQPA
jgi:hypothetical protein